MLPAFRSRASVLWFCGLMIFLLALPLVNFAIGHPSREQAYDDMSTEAGPLSYNLQEIFHDREDADVLFLGSSLVVAAIDRPMVEQALSAQLGRPAHVKILALNWQGLDEQYFLLRDYLETHRARLIVWNLPVPGSRNLQPHVQAFHFVRFGEFSDVLRGLPLRYRLALYGDMALGAPRELLSHLRANRLSPEERNAPVSRSEHGYYGSAFVRMSAAPAAKIDAAEATEMPPYPRLRTKGNPLNDYETYFAQRILELAHSKGATVALLHIPIDEERGLEVMPERNRWSDSLHVDAAMIGVPSAELFANVKNADFTAFYFDQHFNRNGGELFTRSILPAILSEYKAAAHE